MKKILTIETDGIEDQDALRRAMNADRAYGCLFDLREEIIKMLNGKIPADKAELALRNMLENITESVDLDADFS